MENRCVICWAIIPEGRQVCPNCENGETQKLEKESIKKTVPDKGRQRMVMGMLIGS